MTRGEGLVIKKNSDGSKIVVKVSGDVREQKRAVEASRKRCPRCQQYIGVGRPYHEVKGSFIHREPCCKIF
jgi:microcompartment protein CcmL/EutN